MVALGIFLGAVSFEVGWEWDNTSVVEHFGKDEGLVPGELEFKRVVVAPQAGGRQDCIAGRRGNGFGQGAFFPFPVIADEGLPADGAGGGKIQDIVPGQQGFQAKDLYGVARLGLEPDAGLYDAGIVEQEQSACGQQVGQFPEYRLLDVPLPIYQQFGSIAFGEWEPGYALVGQVVAVVLDVDIAGVDRVGSMV